MAGKKKNGKRVVHKFRRNLKSDDQFILCNKKRANFSEHVTYFWRNVTCPKCLKLLEAAEDAVDIAAAKRALKDTSKLIPFKEVLKKLKVKPRKRLAKRSGENPWKHTVPWRRLNKSK